MDNDTVEIILATFMLIFGMAFFLFVIGFIALSSYLTENRRDRRDDITYDRRINEMREFGRRTATKADKRLHPPSPTEPRHRRFRK